MSKSINYRAFPDSAQRVGNDARLHFSFFQPSLFISCFSFIISCAVFRWPRYFIPREYLGRKISLARSRQEVRGKGEIDPFSFKKNSYVKGIFKKDSGNNANRSFLARSMRQGGADEQLRRSMIRYTFSLKQLAAFPFLSIGFFYYVIFTRLCVVDVPYFSSGLTNYQGTKATHAALGAHFWGYITSLTLCFVMIAMYKVSLTYTALGATYGLYGLLYHRRELGLQFEGAPAFSIRDIGEVIYDIVYAHERGKLKSIEGLGTAQS